MIKNGTEAKASVPFFISYIRLRRVILLTQCFSRRRRAIWLRQVIFASRVIKANIISLRRSRNITATCRNITRHRRISLNYREKPRLDDPWLSLSFFDNTENHFADFKISNNSFISSSVQSTENTFTPFILRPIGLDITIPCVCNPKVYSLI